MFLWGKITLGLKFSAWFCGFIFPRIPFPSDLGSPMPLNLTIIVLDHMPSIALKSCVKGYIKAVSNKDSAWYTAEMHPFTLLSSNILFSRVFEANRVFGWTK